MSDAPMDFYEEAKRRLLYLVQETRNVPEPGFAEDDERSGQQH